MAAWLARSCSASPGSHFSEMRSGRERRRGLMAKILPATLNTEFSGPKGNSSAAPGMARHARRSAAGRHGAVRIDSRRSITGPRAALEARSRRGHLVQAQSVDGAGEDARVGVRAGRAGRAQHALGQVLHGLAPRDVDRAQLGPAGRLELQVVAGAHAQQLVAVDLLGQPRRQRSRDRRHVGVALGQRLGVARDALDLERGDAPQRLGDDLVARGEVVGRRGQRHAGLARDGAVGHAVDAVAPDEPDRGLDDRGADGLWRRAVDGGAPSAVHSTVCTDGACRIAPPLTPPPDVRQTACPAAASWPRAPARSCARSAASASC